MKARKDGRQVTPEGDGAPSGRIVTGCWSRWGRRANGDRIGADAAGVEVDERGVIRVDQRMRTNVEHIHAIGDVTGDPMLGAQGHPPGRAGGRGDRRAGTSRWDPAAIPSGAYTDPEAGVDGPDRDGGEGAGRRG